MKYNDIETDDVINISNLFAEFFSTTYSDATFDDSICYPPSELSLPSIAIPFIDKLTVCGSIHKIKFSYNFGPDKIPSCILIKCAESIAVPLTIIFNLSIKLGYFPKAWKESCIIPLFKSGCKNNVINYRGIAKLSVIPKLFEKIITDYLRHHVSPLLSPAQHGFRRGCSTITNLLQLTTFVNRGFVQQMQTDVIYTDFSKAFDKVNHRLLLKKLGLMGFTPNCLSWICSYLTGRIQTVCFKGVTSKPIYVLSGVPQGSHLGPLLFSLFMNDLPNFIKYSNVLMYADDVKIFLSYKNACDHTLLQKDLDSFCSWCSLNLMELNPKKCKYMCFFRRKHISVSYSLNGHSVCKVDHFSDLGILFDAKMNFNQHISLTVNKARAVLGFIKRWAKEFKDPYITKQLFTSLVRPILEYGSVIWDPSYGVYIDSIESVQKQFLLFCLRNLHWNSYNLPSYTNRLALIKLPTLKSRRTMLNVTFVLNLINGNVCSDFLVSGLSFNVPSRPTRHFHLLSVSVFRTNYANFDPFIKICNEFNRLYFHVDFFLDINIVKRNLISYLNR